MANLNAHFVGKRRNRRLTGVENQKWSGRRTIGVALGISAVLWVMIFMIAKSLVA
jgi:hypothetical protein